MCDQQRLRPACAYAQSDQSLCLSLEYSMNIKLLTEHHLEFLSLKGGCTGSSESTFVRMLHYWKSHVTAQMYTKNRFCLCHFSVSQSWHTFIQNEVFRCTVMSENKYGNVKNGCAPYDQKKWYSQSIGQ